jgi:hypothetical protein
VDLFVGELLQRADQPVARVVDQDVDRPGRHRGVDRRPDLAGVGDVQREGEDGVRVLVDEIGDGPRIAGGRDDGLAAGEQGLGEDPSEPGRGTGDEPAHAAHDRPHRLIRPRHLRACTHRRAE